MESKDDKGLKVPATWRQHSKQQEPQAKDEEDRLPSVILLFCLFPLGNPNFQLPLKNLLTCFQLCQMELKEEVYVICPHTWAEPSKAKLPETSP